MDRNQVIGIIIIAAILFGWLFFTQPSKEELAATKRKKDSIAQIQQQKDLQKIADEANQLKAADNSKAILKADTLLSDSAKVIELKNSYGDFSQAAVGDKKFYTLENNWIRVKFSNLGGRVYSVELKEYKTHNQKPLILFNGDENIFGLDFYSQNKTISTNNLFFEPATSDTLIISKTDGKTMKFRLFAGAKDKYIEYEYSLVPNSYLLKFNINFVNVNKVIAQNSNMLDLNWNYRMLSLERGDSWENQNSGLCYKYNDDEKMEELSLTADTDDEKLSTKVKWIAIKQQFFASVLIANNSFANAYVKHVISPDLKQYLKECTAKMRIPFAAEAKESIPLTYYFGPTQYKLLSDISIKEGEKLNLQELVPLGWGIFGWINQYAIIPLFNFLGSFLSNYGLIILIMTVIIKLVIFPLTYKSYLASAKMKVLKPQIEEINSKIPKDKMMERQQATMSLYKKVGVSPFGGCIPLLLQFPILIAMFRFFPASIELRQKGFLWASDLSSYDSIFNLPFTIPMYGDHISLFTLLMAGSIILTTITNPQQMTDANSQMPGMKFMMWLMPVMMVLWFNSYSSGLSYYYFLSNMITFGQIILMRRFVNESDLLHKLNENKKKVVKKSKFQQKLEDMAKQRGYNPPKKK